MSSSISKQVRKATHRVSLYLGGDVTQRWDIREGSLCFDSPLVKFIDNNSGKYMTINGTYVVESLHGVI